MARLEDTEGKAQLAATIRNRRRDMNMSQATLAAAIGSSREQISAVETGRGKLSALELQKASEALGCTVPELLGQEYRPVGRNANYENRLAVLKAAFDKLSEEQQQQVCDMVFAFANPGALHRAG